MIPYVDCNYNLEWNLETISKIWGKEYWKLRQKTLIASSALNTSIGPTRLPAAEIPTMLCADWGLGITRLCWESTLSLGIDWFIESNECTAGMAIRGGTGAGTSDWAERDALLFGVLMRKKLTTTRPTYSNSITGEVSNEQFIGESDENVENV